MEKTQKKRDSNITTPPLVTLVFFWLLISSQTSSRKQRKIPFLIRQLDCWFLGVKLFSRSVVYYSPHTPGQFFIRFLPQTSGFFSLLISVQELGRHYFSKIQAEEISKKMVRLVFGGTNGCLNQEPKKYRSYRCICWNLETTVRMVYDVLGCSRKLVEGWDQWVVSFHLLSRL